MKLFIKNQKELNTYLDLVHALDNYWNIGAHQISSCEYRLVILNPDIENESGNSLVECSIPLSSAQAKHAIRKLYCELGVKTLGALFEIFIFDNTGLYETFTKGRRGDEYE